MGKSLVIVESPAKAKTINKFLGTAFTVKPTGGHIVDLPEREIGIDVENGFTPKYKVIKGKTKTVQELKKAAVAADVIYLATDPDREGEAIAWHVANSVEVGEKPLYRVLINQITRDAVTKAIENRGELDMNKVNAQQARRVLDRLVGYKISPVLWKMLYSGLSAGRVQSVALRLIVERDREIDAFVPEEYWSIVALLALEKGGGCEAKLVSRGGEALRITTGDEASAVVDELKGLPFTVAGLTRKKTTRKPYAPFITSTLQQEAAHRAGYTVSRTMRIAQGLYEGVETDDGLVGLITYMRTDSTRIAPEAAAEAREYIETTWGKDYLPAKSPVYRAKKGAQDAHEAIRPSSLAYSPARVKPHLTAEQLKLYTLIWNRFVASQMNPARYTVVTLDIAAGPYGLRAGSQHLDFNGFLAAYADIAGDDTLESAPEVSLPAVAKGDVFDLRNLDSTQHFTKPPAAFNEASLVKEMEARGIGRPSTYAQIINTIIARKYIDREQGRLKSTELGGRVNDILTSQFPDLFSVDFTAGMEEELDRIESGEYDWQRVMKDFYGPFSTSLEAFNGRRDELKQSLIETTDEVCDQCGKPMIIRWGRNGRFLACSGFPACKTTRPLDEPEPVKTDEVCEKCGSPMEIKNGRYGRFMACSNYPACKNIKSIPLGVKCPQEGCDGDLVEKKTKKGRIFYGCNRYPECTFASWSKPVAQTCPSCGSPSMVTQKGGESLACPRCKEQVELEKAGD